MGRMEDTGEHFLDTLLNRDFAALGGHLDPRVRVRALQPAGAVGRSGVGPAVGLWDSWFDGWDRLTVLDRSTSVVASRLCLTYHLSVSTAADQREVAHQMVVDVAGGRITAVDLLCSGFLSRPRGTEAGGA